MIKFCKCFEKVMRRCFVIMFIEHKFHGVSTGFESVKKLMRDFHEFFK